MTVKTITSGHQVAAVCFQQQQQEGKTTMDLKQTSTANNVTTELLLKRRREALAGLERPHSPTPSSGETGSTADSRDEAAKNNTATTDMSDELRKNLASAANAVGRLSFSVDSLLGTKAAVAAAAVRVYQQRQQHIINSSIQSSSEEQPEDLSVDNEEEEEDEEDIDVELGEEEELLEDEDRLQGSSSPIEEEEEEEERPRIAMPTPLHLAAGLRHHPHGGPAPPPFLAGIAAAMAGLNREGGEGAANPATSAASALGHPHLTASNAAGILSGLFPPGPAGMPGGPAGGMHGMPPTSMAATGPYGQPPGLAVGPHMGGMLGLGLHHQLFKAGGKFISGKRTLR